MTPVGLDFPAMTGSNCYQQQISCKNFSFFKNFQIFEGSNKMVDFGPGIGLFATGYS